MDHLPTSVMLIFFLSLLNCSTLASIHKTRETNDREKKEQNIQAVTDFNRNNNRKPNNAKHNPKMMLQDETDKKSFSTDHTHNNTKTYIQ